MDAAKKDAQKWLSSDENTCDFALKGSDATTLSFAISDNYNFKIKVPTTYPKSGILVLSSPNEELEDWVSELNKAKHTSISKLLKAAQELFDSLAEEQEEVEVVEEEVEEEEKPQQKQKGGKPAATAAPAAQSKGKKKADAMEVEIDDSSMEVEEDEDDRGGRGGRGEGGEDFDIVKEDGGDSDHDNDLIENEYYEAKALKKSKPDQALKRFDKVLSLDTQKGDWGLKALKQSIKLLFTLKRYDEMAKRYTKLLAYMSSNNVSRNDSKKAINTILNLFTNSTETKLLEDFYNMTLNKLLETKNEQLWFSTKLKLGQLKFETKEYDKLKQIIQELKLSCLLPDGREDPSKGGMLLEIYALEIQMYTEQKDKKKLKDLYGKSVTLIENALVPNPRITGIIRECGGKMNMREGNWAEAHQDFFDAFKSYDEAGNPRRINCLRYLVLANMLMSSKINPFAANEAKPYENHPEILAMRALVDAYQHRNIQEFEKILKENQSSILGDSFIRHYIDDLLKNIRTQVLLQILKPYTRIHINYIAKELNIPPSEVEDLCVDLILDGKIDGQIDQINQLLKLYSKSNESNRYTGIQRWASKLQDAHTGVINKIIT